VRGLLEKGLTKFLWKEFFDIVQRPTTPVLMILLSIFVVWTAGQLNVEKPDLRLALLKQGVEKEQLKEAETILSEFTQAKVSVVDSTQQVVDALTEPGLHLGIVRQGPQWIVLHRQPTFYQEEDLTWLANSISSSLNTGHPWFTEPLDLTPTNSETNKSATSENSIRTLVSRLSSLPGQPELNFVPRTIGLISIFIGFVFVIRSYSREVTYRMLPVLLSTPIGGWRTIVAAKIVTSCWFATAIFLFLLLAARTIFGITPKPWLLVFLGIQVLAILISVCLGTVAAISAKTQSQIFILMAAYFLGLVLLSGFLFPLETASPLIRFASNLSPLTFSNPILEHWLFYGARVRVFVPEIIGLGLQLSAAIALLITSVLMARRDI